MEAENSDECSILISRGLPLCRRHSCGLPDCKSPSLFSAPCCSRPSIIMLADFPYLLSFPGGSAGKESTCNAGDLGSIPGLGRSTGEGNSYPLQDSQASLVAQLVKNRPAMWETWVQSLGWEDPLEKGTTTHSSNLAWRIPWTA